MTRVPKFLRWVLGIALTIASCVCIVVSFAATLVAGWLLMSGLFDPGGPSFGPRTPLLFVWPILVGLVAYSSFRLAVFVLPGLTNVPTLKDVFL